MTNNWCVHVTYSIKEVKCNFTPMKDVALTYTDWWTSAGSTCQVGESIMAYVPRIYQYPLYVMGNENESIILPCRYQGLLSSREWLHNNTAILPQDNNHEVSGNKRTHKQ